MIVGVTGCAKFAARLKMIIAAKNAINLAGQIAMEMGHKYVGTEHILYGLACEENGVASKVLKTQGIVPEDILDKIE